MYGWEAVGLSCHSMRDGSEVWQTDVEVSSTGRAGLSGGLIYVPSWDGLASYDSRTGADVGFEPLPAAEPALGNLLCIDNAMFSLDPGSIRRFPDVTRAYPSAVATYSEDPTDVSAAARLAWLEILRGAPDRALEVVGEVSAESQTGAGGATTALANARVEAIARDGSARGIRGLRLTLAGVGGRRGAPPRQTVCAAAWRSRSGSARREGTRRRTGTSCSSVCRPAADIVTPVAEYVEAPARFAVAELLERLGPRLAGAERASLGDELGERLARATTTVHSRDSSHHLSGRDGGRSGTASGGAPRRTGGTGRPSPARDGRTKNRTVAIRGGRAVPARVRAARARTRLTRSPP